MLFIKVIKDTALPLKSSPYQWNLTQHDKPYKPNGSMALTQKNHNGGLQQVERRESLILQMNRIEKSEKALNEDLVFSKTLKGKNKEFSFDLHLLYSTFGLRHWIKA